MSKREGWICSRCGASVSPDQETCPNCAALLPVEMPKPNYPWERPPNVPVVPSPWPNWPWYPSTGDPLWPYYPIITC